MSVAAVELRDLAIGYRSRRRTTTVANNLRGLARRGELTVLLGPNGTGKSTLLRTLCGLHPALGGQVLLDGTDLGRLSPGELAQRVAVVLTERVDPGLLSVRELVGLGRIPYLGRSARLTAADHTVVDWALDAVQARHLATRPAAHLSDGERQRVLTARALAQQTGLLVLDEPTAFLDVSSRVGLMEMLRDLARGHDLAIVLSTHELELALRVADRVWLLDADGTLGDASPQELMLAGHISAVFDHIQAPEPLPVAAVLNDVSATGPFFTIGTGPITEHGWLPVQQLYTDTSLLDSIIARTQARIGAPDRRVAASTFFLGFAARLWSIGVAALAGHQLVPDLAAEQLLFREDDAHIWLHVQHPLALPGERLPQLLADLVLQAHLAPLSAAVQRLGSISNKVLQGNAASALLGAARVFDLHRGHAIAGPAWRLARSLCDDERLTGAITFGDDGINYRRTSCCLYYRTWSAGLCGDCVLR